MTTDILSLIVAAFSAGYASCELMNMASRGGKNE